MTGSYVALKRENFQKVVAGKKTDLYVLKNGRGMEVRFTNLGAKIQQILVPDRHGVIGDVALGYETIEQVIDGQSSMGAFIGRYANRIAYGRFALDGRQHQLAVSDGPHTLHGGPRGSRVRIFDVTQLDETSARLTLRYDEALDGFPGNVDSQVLYRVTDDNALVIEYEATTDSPTIVSFTSHAFFNLAGHGRIDSTSLNRHVLMLNAKAFTPVDPSHIPTGEIRSVAGTPLDFTEPTAIGVRLDERDEQLDIPAGYDHNWVIDKRPDELALHARLYDPTSGRAMEVLSTEPGLVFYGGNKFAGLVPGEVGKGGTRYEFRCALCLEPARFPDSPNHAHFPSARLAPGECYSGTTIYRFSSA